MSGYRALAVRDLPRALYGISAEAKSSKFGAFGILFGVVGGIVAGRYVSRVWPSNPTAGWCLGYSLIGFPLGHVVGKVF